MIFFLIQYFYNTYLFYSTSLINSWSLLKGVYKTTLIDSMAHKSSHQIIVTVGGNRSQWWELDMHRPTVQKSLRVMAHFKRHATSGNYELDTCLHKTITRIQKNPTMDWIRRVNCYQVSIAKYPMQKNEIIPQIKLLFHWFPLSSSITPTRWVRAKIRIYHSKKRLSRESREWSQG